MTARLKLWYANHKNVISMTKFTLVSFILLFIVWLVDVKYPFVKKHIPEFFLLSSDLSNSFLSSLSGVFLTVTTFTFSTILTVMTTHMSNLASSIIQKFINKRHVLSLIGIFIGGFFYTVLSLFILGDIKFEQKVLAGSLGIVYAMASMIHFMIFIMVVIRYIKASNVIQDIYDEGIELVKEEAKRRKESTRMFDKGKGELIQIYSNQTGYFYGVDYAGLFNILKDFKGTIVIKRQIGEFISKGIYLADLSLVGDRQLSSLDKEEKVEYLKSMSECFLFNDEKNEDLDYHNEITNLVEIATTALSSGVKSPNDAISCIEKVSNMIGQLFSTENHYIIMEQNENIQIIYTSYSIEQEMYLAFNQLIPKAKADPSVYNAILEGISLIRMIADDSVRGEVENFFDYAYDIFHKGIDNNYDKKLIENIRSNFYFSKNTEADEEAMREEEE
ncbi:DUF2254 family protein [Peptoniphilus catoniae]|uniref:DUF2254 family protein n=1 Tax=Peptoniphilus catoniae TaxID=1660341 RepID=UPI0010FF0355|nr:DUF2254 family protein [Peptoniphilus catoniae]